MAAYGASTYGDGRYSEVTDGYGFATYGVGQYGTENPRVDGAASMTMQFTGAMDGGIREDGTASVTMSFVASLGPATVKVSGASVTASFSASFDNASGNLVRTAGAALNTTFTGTLNSQPKVVASASMTMELTATLQPAYSPSINLPMIAMHFTATMNGRKKWQDVDPVSTSWSDITPGSETWTDITPPTTTWTDITTPYR